MKDLAEVKQDIEKAKNKNNTKEHKIEESFILFLDVSSACTGYCIAAIDFDKNKARLVEAGAIWFDDSWSHQKKYCYIGNAIANYFFIVAGIDYIVLEKYSMNPKKAMGVCVVPEMTGAIKAYAEEHGLTVDSIPPQSWRSKLKIKKDEKGDWKNPTKLKILEEMDVPDRSISNITGNSRNTPSDLYDAVGVALGWLNKMGITKVDKSKTQFNRHVGAINL